MRFGLFCSPKADSNDLGPETGQGFRDYLDFNIEAEALGFHSSFSVEHHFTGWNQVSATLMLLMALAMRTKTLRLGTAVMVLPWHNPVLLAEQTATLDLVSDGRFDFGIGKGYRHSEFKGFQIAPEEAEARFEEAIELITRAWTTRTRFSHQGRFWHFEDIVVEPPPQRITNPTAVFSGLDKITGRIISFDVAINETVQFGALQVTPRVCYSRPPTETPNTDSFVEVDEVTLQGEIKRIFTGWMFAASPGLHAVEHPIYDVWLTDCNGGKNPNVAEAPAEPPPAAKQPARQPPARRAPPRPQQPGFAPPR